MDLRTSPAVARRHLRLALRRFRESAALTQGEVARRLDWSLSKVNRIELGDVTVSNTDLQALLRLFAVDDSLEIETLSHYCRAARRRNWWDAPEYRMNVTPSMIDFLQFSLEASRIVAFHPTLVPGFLQSQGYAEAVLESGAKYLDPEQSKIRLEFRMKLKEQLIGRENPPECVLIVDESVVLRQVGGPETMEDQLHELLSATRDDRIEVRILPLKPYAFVVHEPSFVLVDLANHDSVVYREHTITDELLDNPDAVGLFRQIVNEMHKRSLSAEASVRLIEARLATVRSELARDA
jgi:transcriptional regulator with XRE-family HTH domain